MAHVGLSVRQARAQHIPVKTYTVPLHEVVRAMAPIRGMTYLTVSQIVTRAFKRVGIELPRYGAHVLRHSAATSLLREGMSLAAIGVVLRHASIETTAIYAKVDVPRLQAVASPWPEVAPC